MRISDWSSDVCSSDLISFRLGSLEDLREFHDFLVAEQVSDIAPINHGNAWAVYFADPEGNRIEAFVDTDWYIEQPCREPLNIGKPARELYRETEAFCRSMPEIGKAHV